MSEELTPMDRMELWMSALNEAITNGTENTFMPYNRYELWMKKLCEAILAKDPADPDVVEAFVNDWLDDHPEATTTVEDGAVTAAKLASNAVETAKIKDSAVTTAKINDGAVTKAKTGNDTLTKYTLIPDEYTGTDAEKIQACLDALSTTGGTIIINRKYTIGENLVHKIDSNDNMFISFIGVGKKAEIDMDEYSFTGNWSANDAIGNLYFDNITFTGSGTCFDCDKLIRINITNCKFTGFEKVFACSTSNSGRIQSVYVTNCVFWLCDDVMYCVGGLYDVKFCQNRVERCNRVFYYGGVTHTTSHLLWNLIVRDCLFEAMQDTCFTFEVCRCVVIDSNYFEANYGCILFTHGDVQGVTITNNFLSNDNTPLVTIANTNDGNTDIKGVIENNIIKYKASAVVAFSGTPTGTIAWRVDNNYTGDIANVDKFSKIYNNINSKLLYQIGDRNDVKTDFNNYKTPGVFLYGGGSSISNAPTTAYGLLEVFVSLYIMQRLTTNTGDMYIRISTNGTTWSNWASHTV